MRKLAILFALLMPFGAQAVTVTEDIFADTDYTFAETVVVGGEAEFSFTFMEDLSIPVFALSASGNNGGIDVGNLTFGFIRPTTDSFDLITSFGASASALDSLPGGSFLSGDTLSIIFEDGIDFDTSVTVSFVTESPAAVPVPASGVLLGLGLLGMAGWRRTKR